jgi:hypothetical protein
MKTILVDAVDTFVIEGDGIYEPLHELLEKYPNKKIILTNANDEQMIEFGLENLPYELFSLKHNPDKIDPKYFEEMLKHYDLKPNDVVYFEHNPKAVESAKSVGIASFYYDSEKRDLESLKIFLDANTKEKSKSGGIGVITFLVIAGVVSLLNQSSSSSSSNTSAQPVTPVQQVVIPSNTPRPTVNWPVYNNSGSSYTFNGYDCTEDCSGHEAGYEWATENDIDDVSDCDGNSNSFNEGCYSYVEENYPEYYEEEY